MLMIFSGQPSLECFFLLSVAINFIFVSVCIEKKGTTDRVHGFAYLTEDNYNVKFVYDNGKYSVKVTWKAPIGK